MKQLIIIRISGPGVVADADNNYRIWRRRCVNVAECFRMGLGTSYHNNNLPKAVSRRNKS